MEILDFCVTELRRLGVEKFEICAQRGTSTSVEFQERKLDHFSQATDASLSFRTLKNRRMGFAYTYDLSRDSVSRALANAIEIGALMPEDPLADLGAADGKGFQSRSYAAPLPVDHAGLAVSLEKKIELARELERACLASDRRIRKVRKASFDEWSGETTLVDSAGARLHSRKSVFSCDITCVAEDGASAETGSDSNIATSLEALDPAAVAATAAHHATELLHAEPAPTMHCPAVFRNDVVAQLLDFLAASFSAENVDKNFSMLIGKLGKKIFSERLTLVDDPTDARGTGARTFDAEGEPTRCVTLLDRGVVNAFLYDGYFARKLGAKSTGSSVRGSAKASPSIGTTGLSLRAGARSLPELVAAAHDGVLVTDIMGLHTANPITGEFSVGASGLLLKNGAIARPIKGFAIAGNLISLLANVREVGSDLRFWGGVGAPSILIESISVGGT